MNLYMTGYKKQRYEEESDTWVETAYISNKVVVLAESHKEAEVKTAELISKFYRKSNGKYRGSITTPTHKIDGLFFVDAYGGEYTTGVKL